MNTKPHILVVDDEPEIREMLRTLFEREEYLVSEAGNGAELFACLENNQISLITLDLQLNGDDGLVLAGQIRSKDNIPIIMITGKGDAVDRIVGLELGADDYIAKPFQLREVLARVRAVLRRYGVNSGAAATRLVTDVRDNGQITFDNWIFNPAAFELKHIDGTLTELTTSEFNLLQIFALRPGRVLSRDNIMDLLKGHDWSPLDRSIDALVGRLRKKIEQTPNNPRIIKTVRGIGYVFTVQTTQC